MTGPGLDAIGLRAGAQVRFRAPRGGRWHNGRVVGVEADGSIDLRDARGRSRAIPVERVEVREQGPRGGPTWTPLPLVVARQEQLGLFE